MPQQKKYCCLKDRVFQLICGFKNIKLLFMVPTNDKERIFINGKMRIYKKTGKVRFN